MVQTYDNYYRNYYQKHKEEIKERYKKQKFNYNSTYYQNNREKILEKRKLDRAAKKAECAKVLTEETVKKLTNLNITEL